MTRKMIGYVVGLLLTAGYAGAAQITLSVDNAAPAVGATVSVTVHASVSAGEAFVSANQFLAFDRTRLELVEQSAGTAGGFVGDSQGLAAINAWGEVRAGVYSLTPISGSVTLGVFRFRALAPGTTAVIARGYEAQGAQFGDLLVQWDGTQIVPGTPGSLIIAIRGGSGRTGPELTGGVLAADGGFTICWLGETNKFYTVQASSNLMAGFTMDLWTGIRGAAPAMNVYTDTTATAKSRFYQVKQE